MTAYTNWTKIRGNWVPRRMLIRSEPKNERALIEENTRWREVWERTKPNPDDGRNFVPGRDDRR